MLHLISNHLGQKPISNFFIYIQTVSFLVVILTNLYIFFIYIQTVSFLVVILTNLGTVFIV